MNQTLRSMRRTTLRLAAFTAVTAAVLGAMVAWTRAPIAAQQQRAQLAALAALLPVNGYDNDPVADRIEVLAPEGLGGKQPQSIYRARRAGQAVAAVLGVTAEDGYSGAIQLLLGVGVDGRVIGVRVIGHQETPGLGDAIEAGRSDWINRFAGRGIGDPPAERWAVRRDGGDFDQFAGATITPRAVVTAIRRALIWFGDNQAQVFAVHNPPTPER
jgi:electron transport complex protein RnfG